MSQKYTKRPENSCNAQAVWDYAAQYIIVNSVKFDKQFQEWVINDEELRVVIEKEVRPVERKVN